MQFEILDLSIFPPAACGRCWRRRAVSGAIDCDGTTVPRPISYCNISIRGCCRAMSPLKTGVSPDYVFCVYEEHKAIIGDVFSLSDSAADVEGQLLRHLIELLRNSPGIDRIECQLLLHPTWLACEAFREAGFKIFRRLFMELDLTQFAASPLRALPEGLSISSWRENDFHPAGYLIADAYNGHLDSFINDQYRSVAGSLRFLHNIVRFPGCGLFDPQSSRALTRTDGSLAGVLLCSRVREDIGHVTQVCVARNQRGLGLGRRLIEECAENLRGRGFRGLTLTVTEENANAVELYPPRGLRGKTLVRCDGVG